ncbi:MAG: hypothetical protein P4M07_07030 [Xanthobacteraceae bacterium]|nr:hypothetical protein [Xanthobacteraceae bacterium]
MSDSSTMEDEAVIRLSGAAEGFGSRAALVVSRLRTTVVASLAVGVLTLGMTVALLAISVQTGAATPQLW